MDMVMAMVAEILSLVESSFPEIIISMIILALIQLQPGWLQKCEADPP